MIRDTISQYPGKKNPTFENKMKTPFFNKDDKEFNKKGGDKNYRP